MTSAQKTWRIGFVKEVVPAGDLIARAVEILNRIAGNAPIAVRFALEAVNKGIGASQESAADESQILRRSQCDVGFGLAEKLSRTN